MASVNDLSSVSKIGNVHTDHVDWLRKMQDCMTRRRIEHGAVRLDSMNVVSSDGQITTIVEWQFDGKVNFAKE
jgi:hypothetical protein